MWFYEILLQLPINQQETLEFFLDSFEKATSSTNMIRIMT